MGIHVPDSFDDADRAFLDSFAPPAGRRIPDGAIIEAIITVISFIDPDTGEQHWFCHTNADIPLSSAVGLLEMSKLDLIAKHGAIAGDPTDDEP